MQLATKERIVAAKHFATERYIRSTKPVLYISGRKDSGGTNIFRSDDAYGHLCTVTGALWTPQGRSFDGIDDKIIVPGHSVFKSSPSAISGMVWYKPSALPAATKSILDMSDSAATYGWALNLNQNEAGDASAGWAVFWRISGGVWSGAGLASALVLDTWVYLGFTYDAANTIVYKNGAVIRTKATVGAITMPAGNPDVGVGSASSSANFVPGIIGAASFYNCALSALGHQNIYLATKWRYR